MTLNRATVERVNSAIVKFARSGGLGVLVPGHLIVTAARVVHWNTTRDLVSSSGDYFFETICTSNGVTHTVQTMAVEPMSDLAILGAPDGHASEKIGQAADAFRAWCATIRPVPIDVSNIAVGEGTLDAFLFTHDKGVLPVQVSKWRPASSTLTFHCREPIEGGASGGPVVTHTGRLLGVVSHGGSAPTFARPIFAAPTWAVRQMVGSSVMRKLDAALPPGKYLPARSSRKTRSGETLAGA
jgi:hypothetical protein